MKRWIIYLWYRLREELGCGRQYPALKKVEDSMSYEDRCFYDTARKYVNPFCVGENITTYNNMWGLYKIKTNEIYNQKLLKNFGNRWGWCHVTPQRNRGVIGYPEAMIGKSPWGGESTDPRFPIGLKEIDELDLFYNVTMYIQPKKYNLTADFWLTFPSSGKIAHEVMVWEDHNIAKPFGKVVGKVTLNGATYKIYHGWMDRSKENLGVEGWYFTAFVRQDRRRVGYIDIKGILDVMVELGLTSGAFNLNNVEFGSEVYNSIGITIVNNLDIKLND